MKNDTCTKTNWTPVPIEILKAQHLSAQAKLVYVDICSYIYRNKEDKQQTIANDLSMSRSMVNQHLQELQNYGLITWIRGRLRPQISCQSFEKRVAKILAEELAQLALEGFDTVNQKANWKTSNKRC